MACQADDFTRVILAGTLIATDRVAGAHVNRGLHIRLRHLGCTSRAQSSERDEYAGRLVDPVGLPFRIAGGHDFSALVKRAAYRVGGPVLPALPPHHRTCGPASGGSSS
jgi:hypothetical protein